jgi:aryl-alcohol dehydrogenase-like predicted oxidoreductase
MSKHFKTSNIIRGCWQLAASHSKQNSSIEPIKDAIECGFTTFDCADIYLGVEELLGKASKIFTDKKLQIHTKFVPDLNQLEKIDRKYIENIIYRSLDRLQIESIDLVQFHWWDFKIKNYLKAAEILFELKALGKIQNIGLTNVNKKYLEEFSKYFDITCLQAQVSLFDRRIEKAVGKFCQNKNIKIFAYGSLLGGFLSEKWLDKKEPNLQDLDNRSLIKYKLLLDASCSWNTFQERLFTLYNLSIKYHCDIASVAIASLLQSGRVDSAIVGLSPTNFKEQNQSLKDLPLLDVKDLNEICFWSCNLQGDIYDEERDINSPHAKTMKYNLNAQ